MFFKRKKNFMSRYTYSLKKYYLWMILYVFMSLASFLILMPLAYYLNAKKNVEHTYIDGKKLRFTGTKRGAYLTFVPYFCLLNALRIIIDEIQLHLLTNEVISNMHPFFSFIVKNLMDAIPLFLVSLLLMHTLFKWAQRNTYFCYELSGSIFETRIRKSLLMAIINKICGTLTFGIFNPLAIYLKQKFIVERKIISYTKVEFDGTIKESYKKFIIRQYINYFTIGLYAPVYLYRIHEWSIIHTHISKPV